MFAFDDCYKNSLILILKLLYHLLPFICLEVTFLYANACMLLIGYIFFFFFFFYGY